ncbi:MAG: LytTR family transcriptional regulator [Lachnospiraceae bacterium]|nr:LytTR family transcriptional regulator [Lachnospiraceae bacterium]
MEKCEVTGMKVRIVKREMGDPAADCSQEAEEVEVVIYCTEETERVRELRDAILAKERRYRGTDGDRSALLDPEEIFYFESVDKKVFACLASRVWQVSGSLERLEKELAGRNYLRASKSVLMNLGRVEEFTSTMGNRIIATMENGEKIVISRHYARRLRMLLK